MKESFYENMDKVFKDIFYQRVIAILSLSIIFLFLIVTKSSATLVGITDLEDTGLDMSQIGDIEVDGDTGEVGDSEAISIRASYKNKDTIEINSTIEVSIVAPLGINQAAVILYDYNNPENIVKIYEDAYIRGEELEIEHMFNVPAPNMPIEKLYMFVLVQDGKKTISRTYEYFMKPNEYMVNFVPDSQTNVMLDTNFEFMIYSKNEIVPLTRSSLKIYNNDTDELIKEYEYYLYNTDFSYDIETSKVIFDNSGTVSDSNIYTNDERYGVCYIHQFTEEGTYRCEISAEDLFGKEAEAILYVGAREYEYEFVPSIEDGSIIDFGEKLSVTAYAKYSDGTYASNGIKSIKLEYFDSNGNSKGTQTRDASAALYGDAKITRDITLSYAGTKQVRVVATVTTPLGKEVSKTFTYNKGDVNVDEVLPIFSIGAGDKMANTEFSTPIYTNEGLLFTYFKVTAVDSNGNVLKLLDGQDAIFSVSKWNNKGIDKLWMKIKVPFESRNDLYYVFEAKTEDGKVFQPADGLKTQDPVYREGPFTVVQNVIKITPQKGSWATLAYGDTLGLTAESQNVEIPLKRLEYAIYSRGVSGMPNAEPGIYEANFLTTNKVHLKENGDFAWGYTIGKGKVKVEHLADGYHARVTVVELPQNLTTPIYCYGIIYSSNSNEWQVRTIPVNEASSNHDVELIYYLSSGEKYYSQKIIELNTPKYRDVVTFDVNSYDKLLMARAEDIYGNQTVSSLIYRYPDNRGGNTFLPDTTTRSEGGIVTVTSHSDYVPLKFVYYKIYDKKNKLVMEDSCHLVTEELSTTYSITIPKELDEKVTIEAWAVTVNNGIHVDTKTYELEKQIVVENPDDPRYVFEYGTFVSGKNEYIIEYEDFYGDMKSVVLKDEELKGTSYFKGNVKNLQMKYKEINEKLRDLGEELIDDINDINCIYIKITLQYINTCQDTISGQYVDIPRTLTIYKKLNDRGNETVSKDYKTMLNEIGQIGNGGLVRDIFDDEKRNEILSKAQYQKLVELDLENLADNVIVNKIYTPASLTIGEIPKIDMSGIVKFNEDYMKENWLTKEDLTNGKLIILDPEVLNNRIHVITDQYYLEDWSVEEQDNSVHEDHTTFFDEVTGASYDICSEKCKKDIKQVWTLNYANIKYEKELIQQAIPTLKYLYQTKDGNIYEMDEGDMAGNEIVGEVNLKVIATWNPKDINQLIKEFSNDAEDGKFGIEFDSRYAGIEGYVDPFSAETDWKKVNVDLSAPNVYLTQENPVNALYLNSRTTKYERSTDRGNKLSFEIKEPGVAGQVVSGIKEIKFLFKDSTMTDYVVLNTENLSTSGIKNRTYTVDLLQLAKGYDMSNGTDIANTLEKGAAYSVKVIVTDFANNKTKGEIYVREKETITSLSNMNKVEELNLFINTTRNTNLIENSNSLINGDGTINLAVANSIGQGEDSGEKSALQINSVMDIKWNVVNDALNKGVNVDQFGLYSNYINDTIGLGYLTSYTLDTVGYGVDSDDRAVVNVKFFVKDTSNKLKEIIPFSQEVDGSYKEIPLKDKYRTLELVQNDLVNDKSIGLTKIEKQYENGICNGARWSFNYFLAANTKFKYKDKLSDDEYCDPDEILVAFDIELYKYYSYDLATNTYNSTGMPNDSRHLYSLRDDKWADIVNFGLKGDNKINYKNGYINLRNTTNNTKGGVIWFDYKNNAIFDITGQRW